MLLAVTGKMCAQQVDPALTAAVVAQTEVLNNIYDNRNKTQKKIIAAEAAVTVAMDRMHQVENKILDYLSNAQGAMQNLYQIKRAAELVTVEIPQNISLVKNSLPGHLRTSEGYGHRSTCFGRDNGCRHADGKPLSVHAAAGNKRLVQCHRLQRRA